MRLVGKKLIGDYYRKHSQSKSSLQSWVDEVERASWKHISDLKNRYPSADYVNGFTIFNINGNNHRLAVEIVFLNGTVVVKWIGTHAEYNRKNAKGGFTL
ncbi:type II toxin-antitoxin system HigB family toxin [Yersinia enterocolitica]|uniref:type II toxin-antitoxin system HigB family toxin n=1 Tax=Yersinia TaxID=629 RepID=UPI0011A3D337|nr:type II toxin-antitoxin system HigB family toxin [Yersinia enterocolitica]EKN4145848.1 type II toxin-antitoxin system HigB family toxin [Yersinia enterocolitica]EKN6066493.1 type II toxin-antitoxin system HigB family toxin [Yersinia enterocolitica]ELZ0587277.1 type II toxin-antitoxin system HigB family toxin [Yersinia enterocolitica]MBW5857528.1 type II toxin-antitoxin system HigB family toxin [Yersinia enterocolitica]